MRSVVLIHRGRPVALLVKILQFIGGQRLVGRDVRISEIEFVFYHQFVSELVVVDEVAVIVVEVADEGQSVVRIQSVEVLGYDVGLSVIVVGNADDLNAFVVDADDQVRIDVVEQDRDPVHRLQLRTSCLCPDRCIRSRHPRRR